MIWALLDGKTNDSILEGPPGLDAPVSRKARMGQGPYRLEQQQLLEEQELRGK
jgi:hypothetical protein